VDGTQISCHAVWHCGGMCVSRNEGVQYGVFVPFSFFLSERIAISFVVDFSIYSLRSESWSQDFYVGQTITGMELEAKNFQ
jgi:hypothetical protein